MEYQCKLQLGICRDEGAADGGIVVQDCLEMMNNLLRGNPKNQLLFRSSALLSSLLCCKMLAFKP